MSRIARKILCRYSAGSMSLSGVVDAWEGHVIDRYEFGAIIGEAS